jgi:hypothetical protein
MRAAALVAAMATAAIPAATVAATAAAPIVNYLTGLNPIAVERIVTPYSVADVVAAVRTHPGPVCIG